MSRFKIDARYCPSRPKNSFQNRNSYIFFMAHGEKYQYWHPGCKQDAPDETDPIVKSWQFATEVYWVNFLIVGIQTPNVI